LEVKLSTITLDLPRELEIELKATATQIGLSLSEYILRVLSKKPVVENAMPKTGAELVAYWKKEGLCGYRSDIVDSQKQARAIREQAERMKGKSIYKD
jgi:ABC-type uncharacterized transport system substrate-binding protein